MGSFWLTVLWGYSIILGERQLQLETVVEGWEASWPRGFPPSGSRVSKDRIWSPRPQGPPPGSSPPVVRPHSLLRQHLWMGTNGVNPWRHFTSVTSETHKKVFSCWVKMCQPQRNGGILRVGFRHSLGWRENKGRERGFSSLTRATVCAHSEDTSCFMPDSVLT